MYRVLISASFPEPALARQTPGGKGAWEEFQFLFEPDGKAVDAWTVYDNLRQVVTQNCKAANSLLVTGEPVSVRRYRNRFTNQFNHVWTSHDPIRHRNKTLQHEAQPWHYGLYASQVHSRPLSFDDLVKLECPKKAKLLSVICSHKTMTPDHRRRLALVDRLREAFGDEIDVFGRGVRDCSDKADAIYQYKYHVVLENDCSEAFMTEKLPDAFLGWTYPIYAGGNAASGLFPAGSFTRIEMNEPELSIARIRTALAQNEFENKLLLIRQARELVLWKYNLFAMLADFWRNNLRESSSEPITLYPKRNRSHLLARQLHSWGRRFLSARRATTRECVR